MLRSLGVRLLLFMMMVLVLAGCFRQAGQGIDSPQTEPILELEETANAITGADADLTELPITSTLPDIAITTIANPTQSAEAPDFGGPAALEEIDTQPLPTITDLPEDAEMEDAMEAMAAEAGSATPGFITPGGPPVPITELPSPTPLCDSPTSTPSGLITPTAIVATDDCTYTVSSGDNLFRIASSNDATLEEMYEANPELVPPDPLLSIGQVLNLPNCGEEQTVMAEDAMMEEDTSTAPTGANSAPIAVDGEGDAGIVGSADALNPGGRTHTVVSGDTLYTIAIQYGTTITAISEANDLANPDDLDIGQVLIIP